MNILEEEKKLFNLLTLMESIRSFAGTKIKLNCDTEEFTVTLTSNNDYKKNGTNTFPDYTNKIEIAWQNGNKLVFEKHLEYRHIDGKAYKSINYTGNEVLSNKKLIELSNHHLTGKNDAIEYIKKSQEKEIDGVKLKIIYDGNIPCAVAIVKKGPIGGKIPITLEKNKDMILLTADQTDCYRYLYNSINDTYYIKVDDQIIPLEEIEKKLKNIENSLLATKKCLAENELPYMKTLNLQLLTPLDCFFEMINTRRKIIEYMKKIIEAAIKNDYFKKNSELIEFSKSLNEDVFTLILTGIEMMKNENYKETEISDKEKKYIFKKSYS